RVTNKLDQASVEILRYQYDANSRLTNRWSAAKGNTAYTYDNVGNLTFVNYPSSTDITRSYDALNRMTNMVDSAGTTKFTYYAGGLLWTEDGPWANDTVTNTYNNARLRSGLVLQQPTGTSSNGLTYDAQHQLIKLSSPASTVASEDRGNLYDAAWNVNKRTNNGVVTTFTVDTKNQLIGDSPFNDSYDSNGNLSSRTYSSSTYSYSYDDENQLTSASYNTS